MFWAKFHQKQLANELESLRSGVSSLVLDLQRLSNRVEKLESERYARETELTDLRTRFETLIKRIQARVDRPVDEKEKRESTFEVRERLRR